MTEDKNNKKPEPTQKPQDPDPFKESEFEEIKKSDKKSN